MMVRLTAERLRYLRLRAQQLTPQAETTSDVAQVVRAVGGLQAQEAASVPLAIRARSDGLTATAVQTAREQTRSIVRTWLMRGTLHVIASEDLAWLLALCAPVFIPANRRRRLELGLDDATCALGLAALQAILAKHGPLTRAEIKECLADRGIRVEGQAAPHLLFYAALHGLICHGPDDEREPRYVLLEDWLGRQPTIDLDQARAKLVRRYLTAYGPGGPEDIAAWSGLPLRDMRETWRRLAGEMLEIETPDGPVWWLKSQADGLDAQPGSDPIVRLLPRFDTYLLGYRDRSHMLAPEYASRINKGGGMIAATVLADGRLVGTWASQRRGQRLEISVVPFENLDERLRPGVEAEVADLGRFLGVSVSWQVQPC